jgi:signal transduction histidine kinase/CheY-like chemotaxis protein
MRVVWDTLRTKGAYRSESSHRRKDGSEFPVEILTTYVQYDGKEYACGFARDISERKAAEAERATLQEQLAQAQKMESVGRLAGGVAHDFNNMLGVILGQTELALEKVDPSQSLHGDLQSIRSAGQRSAELTRQLLAFARKQTVAPKVLHLNETVAGMLKMVKRLIGEDVELVWRPGQNLWSIRIDPAQVDQIVANLCVNARDAISNVGTITIETGIKVIGADDARVSPDAVPGSYVWLTVRDDGCGMAPSVQAHVFEPFFTTKEIGKGTGLGLATVYGIVKQNKGFIELHSERGQGTVFTIYLPRHSGKDAHARADAVTGAIAPGRETILLVEDEALLLDVTQRILEKRGYKVLAASTPGQALQLARDHVGAIDLLITDVVMPEMNGRDLAKNFLSLYPLAKRLFMSGYTADVIAHQGVLEEGVSFIQKPFPARDLAAMVRGLLDTVCDAR